MGHKTSGLLKNEVKLNLKFRNGTSLVEMCVCTLANCAVSYSDMPGRVFAPQIRPGFFWSKLGRSLTSFRRDTPSFFLHFQTSHPLAHRRDAGDLLSYARGKNDVCAGCTAFRYEKVFLLQGTKCEIIYFRCLLAGFWCW